MEENLEIRSQTSAVTSGLESHAAASLDDAKASVEQEAMRTNRRGALTPLGRMLFGALDVLGVDKLAAQPCGAYVVSLALGAVLYAIMFQAGALFRNVLFVGGPAGARVFPIVTHAGAVPSNASAALSASGGYAIEGEESALAPRWLQGGYDLVFELSDAYLPRWLGVATPMFPSVVALGTYGVVAAAFTALDCLRTAGVKERMFQPSPAGFFGGPGLGLQRVLNTHLRFVLALIPIYIYLVSHSGPHMYPPPWSAPCEEGCGEEGSEESEWALTRVAPTVAEFVLHISWCLVAMDAAYWYWHWMHHKVGGERRESARWSHTLTNSLFSLSLSLFALTRPRSTDRSTEQSTPCITSTTRRSRS